MPRTDINSADDLIRVIGEEVPETEDVINTPFTTHPQRTLLRRTVGVTEAGVAQRAILANYTPENGFNPEDTRRLDFNLRDDISGLQRLAAASATAERNERYR